MLFGVVVCSGRGLVAVVVCMLVYMYKCILVYKLNCVAFRRSACFPLAVRVRGGIFGRFWFWGSYPNFPLLKILGEVSAMGDFGEFLKKVLTRGERCGRISAKRQRREKVYGKKSLWEEFGILGGGDSDRRWEFCCWGCQ